MYKTINITVRSPWPWFNVKMTSYQYSKSHSGDKTFLRPSYLHNGISSTGKTTSLYWASLTGLTVVSKFKPRLHAQWAVGTHRRGISRMEKVTSRMNWPIRNSTQIWIRIYLIGNTIMWNPSLFFISIRFNKTQNNFGPLNDDIITEFSWAVTMAPVVPSTDILQWPVTSQWPSSRRLKLWCMCYIR